MITGIVTDDREAVISLALRGPNGDEQEFEAVIDTGFDGSLTAPPGVIAALGLPLRRRGRALLADGSATVFDIYEATVMWDGKARRVSDPFDRLLYAQARESGCLLLTIDRTLAKFGSRVLTPK